MSPLGQVHLSTLIARTRGGADVPVGLIDGPVDLAHPDFAGRSVRFIAERRTGGCDRTESAACLHGTFTAGILTGGETSPAICRDSPLLVRPIFVESAGRDGAMPLARPEELAAAIYDCLAAGVRVINLSVAVAQPGPSERPVFTAALDAALRQNVLVVAAAGNQGTLGSSALTRHPWVIPVAGCDAAGRPMAETNLAASIGRRGLLAPGEAVSLKAAGGSWPQSGTSVAVPFVTATLVLLWSAFPAATAAMLIRSVTVAAVGSRRSVVPPLLNAETAWRDLAASCTATESARAGRDRRTPLFHS